MLLCSTVPRSWCHLVIKIWRGHKQQTTARKRRNACLPTKPRDWPNYTRSRGISRHCSTRYRSLYPFPVYYSVSIGWRFRRFSVETRQRIPLTALVQNSSAEPRLLAYFASESVRASWLWSIETWKNKKRWNNRVKKSMREVPSRMRGNKTAYPICMKLCKLVGVPTYLPMKILMSIC